MHKNLLHSSTLNKSKNVHVLIFKVWSIAKDFTLRLIYNKKLIWIDSGKDIISIYFFRSIFKIIQMQKFFSLKYRFEDINIKFFVFFITFAVN